MATSGSFSGSIKSGNYKLRVDWSATQNVTNNTSNITATMYLVIAPGWSLNIASRSDNTTAIAGTSHTWSSPAINKGGSTTKLATVTSGNIAHNSDGTKSVTISATFYIRATISGVYYEKITASQTVTLNTIPRATTPKLSSTSAFMGDSVIISTPRASSSFTHDLAYQFAGGSWVSIATGVATSKTWTVPDLAASIPNASSVALTIRCITKNGSTTIGTKTVSMTAKVPTGGGYYPPAPTVTLTEAASELLNEDGSRRFSSFIQGRSKIKATITALGAEGSTVKSVSTTFLGGTYSGTSWTTGVVGSSGSLSMKTTVKDSRGRNTQVTVPVEVLAYTKPQVQLFNVYRVKVVDDELVPDNDGTHAMVEYAYSVNKLNNENTAKAVIQYKPTTETEWTTLHEDESLIIEGASFSTVGRVTELSTDLQYDFRLVVRDHFGDDTESIAPALLPSGEVIVDILRDGSGIGIGTTASLSGVCDIKMQTRLQGGTMYVLIPEGANIDELRTPGRYVGDNAMSTQYKGSVPFTGGTFDLDVIAAGPEGQVKQVATRCDKYEVRTRTRFYYGGGWGPWMQESTLSNQVLWNGAKETDPGGMFMTSAQVVDLSGTPLSAQPNGIVLVFTYFPGTKAENTAVQEFYIHKQSVALDAEETYTASRVFPLFSIGMNLFAVKTLYITDTYIGGHANNGTTITGSNGISYQNDKFVLRYVLSF